MINLTHISPFFIVESLRIAVDFYDKKFGFELQYLMPGEVPYFAIVRRDNISIMLKEIAGDVKAIPNHTRHKFARWDAFIHTADPDQLFEEYRLKGVTFNQGIKNDDDGLRGFEIVDADGYVLFFGRPLPQGQ